MHEALLAGMAPRLLPVTLLGAVVSTSTGEGGATFQAVGNGYCRAGGGSGDDGDHPWEPQMKCIGLSACQELCHLQKKPSCAGIAWTLESAEMTRCKAMQKPRCNMYLGDAPVSTVSETYQEYTCYKNTAAGAANANSTLGDPSLAGAAPTGVRGVPATPTLTTATVVTYAPAESTGGSQGSQAASVAVPPTPAPAASEDQASSSSSQAISVVAPPTPAPAASEDQASSSSSQAISVVAPLSPAPVDSDDGAQGAFSTTDAEPTGAAAAAGAISTSNSTAGELSSGDAKVGDCDTVCVFEGMEDTCRNRIQWSADNQHIEEHSPCAKAYAQVRQDCPVCAQCSYMASRCATRNTPDDDDDEDADKDDEVEEGAAPESYDCDSGLANADSDKKTWCCENEDKGCEDELTEDTGEDEDEDGDACSTVCEYKGTSLSCRDRVVWLMDNSDNSCSESVKRVQDECAVCTHCTTSDVCKASASSASGARCVVKQNGEECQFPFTYEGQTYTACTKKDHETSWCATKVDDQGEMEMVDGSWGDCSDECDEEDASAESENVSAEAENVSTKACQDGDEGIVDSDERSCGSYVGAASMCGYYDDDDFIASQMCCACGGGESAGAEATEDSIEHPTEDSTEGSAEDSVLEEASEDSTEDSTGDSPPEEASEEPFDPFGAQAEYSTELPAKGAKWGDTRGFDIHAPTLVAASVAAAAALVALQAVAARRRRLRAAPAPPTAEVVQELLDPRCAEPCPAALP